MSIRHLSFRSCSPVADPTLSRKYAFRPRLRHTPTQEERFVGRGRTRRASYTSKGSMERSDSRHAGLWLIAVFKLLKGLLLLAVGIGALNLLHKDVTELVTHWINLLRVDPDNRYIHRLMAKFPHLDDRKLKEISAGTFFYAALLLTEGIGLSLRKRWAEYFTIIATGSLIPLEVYELLIRPGLAKAVVIGINVAVVAYLVVAVRRKWDS